MVKVMVFEKSYKLGKSKIVMIIVFCKNLYMHEWMEMIVIKFLWSKNPFLQKYISMVCTCLLSSNRHYLNLNIINHYLPKARKLFIHRMPLENKWRVIMTFIFKTSSNRFTWKYLPQKSYIYQGFCWHELLMTTS